MAARMFTVRMTDDLGILDLMCCIPVDESFDGAERMEFDETHALCIYYRGPYEGTAEAMRVLMEHVSKNGIKPAGRLRSVYLEGPPNRAITVPIILLKSLCRLRNSRRCNCRLTMP